MTSNAINGYRRLLRSTRNVFKNDSYALKQARLQLKSEFIKNKNITNNNELVLLLQGIDEVDEMLRFNIVQGKLNDRGNYGK
jgi:intein-encoded DNA endonuclease-like protein